MEPLEWVFVVTAVTLVFIVFAVNPMRVAIEEVTQSNAQMQAQRIASAINLAESAPDGTTYTFDLPSTKCKVTITENFVRMTVKQNGADVSHTVSIIKTSTPITTGDFDCEGKRQIIFKKSSGMLGINFR